MMSDLNLWEEALARQHAMRSEVARQRLAAIVSKPRHPAFRAVLARGLRDLADWLDGQVRPGQQSAGAREVHSPPDSAWGVLH
jgi:hypothetical protein